MPTKKKKYGLGDSAKKAGQRDRKRKRELYNYMMDYPLTKELQKAIEDELDRWGKQIKQQGKKLAKQVAEQHESPFGRGFTTSVGQHVHDGFITETLPLQNSLIPPFKIMTCPLIDDSKVFMVNWRKFEEEIFKSLMLPENILGNAVITNIGKDNRMKIEVIEKELDLVEFKNLEYGTCFTLHNLDGSFKGEKSNLYVKIKHTIAFEDSNVFNLHTNCNGVCGPNWLCRVVSAKIVVE